MSDAFRQYPFHISVVYTSPVQCGPANVLYPAKTGYQATMWGIPYDDLDGWRGPYPPEVFAAQFEKMAAGWRSGIAELQAAVEKTPPDRHRDAQADLRLAQGGSHAFSIGRQPGPLCPCPRRTGETVTRRCRPKSAIACRLKSNGSEIRNRPGPPTFCPRAARFADRLRALLPVLLLAAGPGGESGQLPLGVGTHGAVRPWHPERHSERPEGRSLQISGGRSRKRRLMHYRGNRSRMIARTSSSHCLRCSGVLMMIGSKLRR